MTRDELATIIHCFDCKIPQLEEAMRAWAWGEDVEYRCKTDPNDEWTDCEDPTWNVDTFEYRRKQYEEWTRETCPLKIGDVIVVDEREMMITMIDLALTSEAAYPIYAGGTWWSYHELFKKATFKGKKCGTGGDDE